MAKLFSLSWLSPRIVDAILAGRQPESLTRHRLLGTDLPVEWEEQASALGLPPR